MGSVRDDVRVVVIENDGRPAGFFPHQRAAWGRGSPVGGALSDYHGVIAAPEAEWSVVELMRAARLSVWSFDHLVDPTGRFAPYVTASAAASPQIDLASFEPPPDFARKARKLAREVGELSFSLHAPGSGALERMFEWKSEQYRRTGLTDAFGVRWTRALLEEVMGIEHAGFAGACSVLRAGDEIVAVHAGMRSQQRPALVVPDLQRRAMPPTRPASCCCCASPRRLRRSASSASISARAMRATSAA